MDIDRGEAQIVRYDHPGHPGGLLFTEAKWKALAYYRKKGDRTGATRIRAMKKRDVGVIVTR